MTMTGLTSEMNRALWRMRQTTGEIGTSIDPTAVPRGTARALERRGLALIRGNRVFLTDEGRDEAERQYRAVRGLR